MGRLFAYCRVSTTEQSTDNQVIAIRNAGYPVEDRRVISETVSGGLQASRREKFSVLINDKLEEGDTLIVLKLDRLGRDNRDVQDTIERLMNLGVKVISLDLPVSDLTSAQGKLVMQMFAVFAEWEKNRLVERTQEGLARAKANGKQLGRPAAPSTTKSIQALKSEGLSQSKVAKELSISISTVKRHWNKEVA